MHQMLLTSYANATNYLPPNLAPSSFGCIVTAITDKAMANAIVRVQMLSHMDLPPSDFVALLKRVWGYFVPGDARWLCPLWVKSRHVQCNTACPLYPQ